MSLKTLWRRLFAKKLPPPAPAPDDGYPLPPEFEPPFYRDRHSDLARHDAKSLADHYERHGRAEGRIATRAVPRANFVALLPKDKPILEIGPFANPAVTTGNVRYFDLMDQAGLIARAKSIDVPTENIPVIHYISPYGDLGVVTDRMDYVVSSHCIEHQPDLVKHLRQVENVLSDDGLYFLVVPDKRYCFDHFLAESTVARVLEAHYAGRTVHTLASLVEHRALTTHNDSLRHWRGDYGDLPNDLGRYRYAIHEHETSAGAYIDIHAWQFTPDSFRHVIQILHDLSLTTFAPVRVYHTPYGSNEFYAVLAKRP